MTLRTILNQMLRDTVGPQIDWRATFLKFNELHGGEPVVADGQLLYADCWRWSSATSHMARAIPPPTAVADLLAEKKNYWMLRREVLMKRIMHVERVHAEAKRLQLTVNHPLVFGNGYEEDFVDHLQDLVADAEQELLNLTTDTTEEPDDRDRTAETALPEEHHQDAGGDADAGVLPAGGPPALERLP
jgi:hypothetical protein